MRTLGYFALLLVVAALILFVARRRASRWAVRTIHRRRLRVHRFKLARRALIRASLLADADVQVAAKSYAAEHGISDADAIRRVASYIDEIVPFFNILTYYKIGYVVEPGAAELLLQGVGRARRTVRRGRRCRATRS